MDPLYNNDILDYEEVETNDGSKKANSEKNPSKIMNYSGIHTTSFKDFMLKAELLKGLEECGFEHPSEVQQQCIPNAILGMDILCQAKSGMGKTAVFVLTTLHQLDDKPQPFTVLAFAPTRELAYQIKKEYERIGKLMKDITCEVFTGGNSIKKDIKILKSKKPHIVIGTPGRILELSRKKLIEVKNIKHFVIDECDKVIDTADMRNEVQKVFLMTQPQKQTMMFSATMTSDTIKRCKKFLQSPTEIIINDEKKLTLEGLKQFYVLIEEKEKNRKLTEILDNMKFNQLIIFVKNKERAKALNKLLNNHGFPTKCIHAKMNQDKRFKVYESLKKGDTRILVSTDLLERGVDIEKINIVVNYDIPFDTSSYLHKVGRAGRFGTKGLAITFVSGDEEVKLLNETQGRFEVKIEPLPKEINSISYMNC